MENHIEELLVSQESNHKELTKLKNIEKLNIEMSIECLKYKKYKKLGNLFTNKEKEQNKCDNPICSSNLISLIELSRRYDKLLVENAELKNENFRLKRESTGNK